MATHLTEFINSSSVEIVNFIKCVAYGFRTLIIFICILYLLAGLGLKISLKIMPIWRQFLDSMFNFRYLQTIKSKLIHLFTDSFICRMFTPFEHLSSIRIWMLNTRTAISKSIYDVFLNNRYFPILIMDIEAVGSEHFISMDDSSKVKSIAVPSTETQFCDLIPEIAIDGCVNLLLNCICAVKDMDRYFNREKAAFTSELKRRKENICASNVMGINRNPKAKKLCIFKMVVNRLPVSHGVDLYVWSVIRRDKLAVITSIV